ncbi:MAG TPA: hypothetical protein ENN80_15810 [Candidatus Hydrogenedentes bacterium]|nr:hypothetical protein [Candidatus Hydrogenedentota bacterium]
MNVHDKLIRMLRQLLEDTHTMQSQGAGYYSCIPLAARYNKLLAQATKLFAEDEDLIGMFEPIPEEDPKDPAAKMIIVQRIRIEINQLVSLLDSERPED